MAAWNSVPRIVLTILVVALVALSSIAIATASTSGSAVQVPYLAADNGNGNGNGNGNSNGNGNGNGNDNNQNDNNGNDNNGNGNSNDNCSTDNGNNNGNGNGNGNANSNDNCSVTSLNGISTKPDEAAVGAQPTAADTIRTVLPKEGGSISTMSGDATLVVTDTGVQALVALDPADRRTDPTPPFPLGLGLRPVQDVNVMVFPYGFPTNASLVLRYGATDAVGLPIDNPGMHVMYWSVPFQRWVEVPAIQDPLSRTVTVNNLDVSAFLKFTRVTLLAEQ